MGYTRPRIYSVHVSHVSHTFGNGETRVYGYFSSLSPSATVKTTSIPLPVAGTIRNVALYFFVGTAGTSENVEYYIRVNDTTDYVISTTVKFDAGAGQYVTVLNNALNIPIAIGDTFQIKVVTPTWVTAPLNIRNNGVILIETA